MKDKFLFQNKSSWNKIANDFFGVTALPIYGCIGPTEDELNLFPELANKQFETEFTVIFAAQKGA